jgi:hypothetical protein
VKIIGAGLPRTGTLTQKIALEMLGVGPCYHMTNILIDMSLVPQWADALYGQCDWNEIFAGFEATVDWPGAYFYRELMDVYPDAKVLLSVRDGESWARSMHDTIWGVLYGDTMMHDLGMAASRIDPGLDSYAELMRAMFKHTHLLPSDRDHFDTAQIAAAMEQYNDSVRQYVPADRLLVWSTADGWKPLCEFVGAPVPPMPLPHTNDTKTFADRIFGMCMSRLNDWHDQQTHPADSSH